MNSFCCILMNLIYYNYRNIKLRIASMYRLESVMHHQTCEKVSLEKRTSVSNFKKQTQDKPLFYFEQLTSFPFTVALNGNKNGIYHTFYFTNICNMQLTQRSTCILESRKYYLIYVYMAYNMENIFNAQFYSKSFLKRIKHSNFI